MDPNLFHLDWARVSEVLAAVVVLSFVVERALAVVFESKFFLKRFDGKGVKELIAVAVSVLVCVRWNFDVFSMIVLTDKTSPIGEFFTGMVIAGGSKASLKLFHDVHRHTQFCARGCASARRNWKTEPGAGGSGACQAVRRAICAT